MRTQQPWLIVSELRTLLRRILGTTLVKEFSPKHPILSVTNQQVVDIYQ